MAYVVLFLMIFGDALPLLPAAQGGDFLFGQYTIAKLEGVQW